MLIDVYIFFVFILSSFLQTTTGFGFAIVTAPLLALVLPPKETVMLTMLTGLISRTFLLRTTLGEGSFKAIYRLLAASLIGAVPGAYIMVVISNDGLRLFIGFVLLVACVVMWKNFRLTIANHKLAEMVVGGISGFLSTTTSINGPPIVLYYLNSNAEQSKGQFRGNLSRYFWVINILSIGLSSFSGTLKVGEVWLPTLMSIPALLIGLYLGDKVFHRISAEVFRKASLCMIIVSSLIIIVTTLHRLL